MTTIAIHLLLATTLASHQPGRIPAAATRGAVQAAEGMTAIFLFTIILLIVATASAATALASLLTELLRATLKVTYALVAVVAVITGLAALLLHH